MDISFEQLIQLIKRLPDVQLKKLKTILNDSDLKKKKDGEDLSEFQQFLLKGLVFTKEQLAEINETRKRINQWRTK